jgi:FSR family fosmidomycin resistance protein-like MFS transporter
MIILAPAITGLAMSFMGIAPNYPTLAILLFVAGLSAAFFHVASPVLIKEFAGKNIARSMGYYMFGGEIARTLGPLLIIAAISWWGLEGSYRVLPIGILASLILYFQLRNFTHIPKSINSQSSESRAAERKKHIPLFTGIAGFLFFNAGMKAFLTIYLVVYLVDQGNSLWLASISLSILQLSGAAGSILSGYIVERTSHRTTLLISSIASPILLLGLFHLSLLTIPLLILVGFTFFIATPVIMAAVQEQATERPVFFNSIYMTISFAINSLMVLLVGVSSDWIGMNATMLITAIMAFGSVAFVFLFPAKKI